MCIRDRCTVSPSEAIAIEGITEKMVDYEECRQFVIGTADTIFSTPITVVVPSGAGNLLCRLDNGSLVKLEELAGDEIRPVSYPHLDVYKRQIVLCARV